MGLEAVVPERTPAKAVGVSGIGYQLRDPQTGSAAYRILGGTDGGDGETPCAERQRVPITQAVFDVVATTILLAALAVAIIYTGGTGAAPGAVVLQQLMAAMGLTFLTFRATAGDDLCQAVPIPHKGGPNGYQSGLCADSLGNIYPGQDACLKNVAFDALTIAKTLWEVKVIDFSNNPEFIVDSQIKNKDIPQLKRQQGVIAGCPQYQHGWAVADIRHFILQKIHIIGILK